MLKRVYSDPIAQGQLDRTDTCLERSRSVLKTFRSLITESREAMRSSRELIKSLPQRSIDGAEQAIARNPLLAMDDETISDLVDDLTASYQMDCATDDDKAMTVTREALKVIGRHLAKEIGPKAAGVPLS